MTLGEKIQSLRKQSGMSQEQLAAKLLVTRQAISRWELCESLPDVDNIVQLSEAFNVTTDYLLKNGVCTSSIETAGVTAGATESPPRTTEPEIPTVTHTANITKHSQPKKAHSWSPMIIGVIGTIVAGLDMLSRQHNNVLFPIAGIAAMVGLIIIYVPQIQALSIADAKFKLGRAFTDIGILSIIVSGLFFSGRNARTVLVYAEIMAWVGLAIVGLCIIRYIIHEHSRTKPIATPKTDTDELSKMLQSESKQPLN